MRCRNMMEGLGFNFFCIEMYGKDWDWNLFVQSSSVVWISMKRIVLFCFVLCYVMLFVRDRDNDI